MKMFLTLYIIFMSLIVGCLCFGFMWNNVTHQYKTQQICDRSRAVISGSLEQACSDVQQRYGTEYLCSSLQSNAMCWVEVK